MIYTLKLVLFITFLVISLLADKIFGKNKKIWKIEISIPENTEIKENAKTPERRN